MQSILEEFAYGNVSLPPCSLPQTPAYKEAARLAAVNEENLLARLNEEEKDIFEKFLDAQGEAHHFTEIEHLIRGYKLGVLMTAEVFVTGGDLTAG